MFPTIICQTSGSLLLSPFCSTVTPAMSVNVIHEAEIGVYRFRLSDPLKEASYQAHCKAVCTGVRGVDWEPCLFYSQ